MNTLRNTILVAGLLLAAIGGRAQTLISDDFNAGGLGTNSGGTGNGFVSGGQSAVSESGGVVAFTTGGFSVLGMTSSTSDAFNPVSSTAKTLTVTFGTLGFNASFDRQWIGFVRTGVLNSGNYFIPQFGNQGIYLSVAYNNAVEDGNYGNASPHRGNLLAVSDTGVISTLASWDWVSQPTDGFSVSLATSASSYAMSFTGAMVSSYAIGGASGSLTGLGTVSTNFDVAILHQTASGGSTGSTIDSVSLVVGGIPIPEPSTYAVIAGVLSIGCALWRRRRA